VEIQRIAQNAPRWPDMSTKIGGVTIVLSKFTYKFRHGSRELRRYAYAFQQFPCFGRYKFGDPEKDRTDGKVEW
jgi:hypothetical protein